MKSGHGSPAAVQCGIDGNSSEITTSVTGRRRYALTSDSAGFAAPVHAFDYPAVFGYQVCATIDKILSTVR